MDKADSPRAAAAWYINRLRQMGPGEVIARLGDELVKARWRLLMGRAAVIGPTTSHPFVELGIAADGLTLDSASVATLVAAGERLLARRLTIFGREIPLPGQEEDWFVDADTGVIAPRSTYAFDIEARNPVVVGNHKFLLEPSRLQHTILLAGAYFVTEREPFAQLAAAQLQSWWRANPFLTGVHWTSGIEVGLRLVSFAWARRTLAGWTDIRNCFEDSALACQQIYRHQQYLASLRSHGSSANNHLIAELLGLYIGATAFPWFRESQDWAASAAEGLEREALRQVFSDGISREQASEYHGFVLEMLMTAAIEGILAGRPFSQAFHDVIARMADAWAAVLDTQLQPPRQGDSDDAYVLLLDAPDRRRRAQSLLAAAGALVDAAPWWPAVAPDLRSSVFTAVRQGRVADPGQSGSSPERRPNLFPDAGLALLRDLEPGSDELWCRCDHGPHGYLSIAAHAHADALSIEVRHGGVGLLVDPGTYCYLTEPETRRYFRSTIGHNCLELDGEDQAFYGGPFLWLDAPKAYLVDATGLGGGSIARWIARHEGYAGRLGHPIHERSVTLDREKRRIEIEDRILGEGRFRVRLAYHLGPAIKSNMVGGSVALDWQGEDRHEHGQLALPSALIWRSFHGSQAPFIGWYSPMLGEHVPSTTWVGEGTLEVGTPLRTILGIHTGHRQIA
jgi:hypothetical protein